MPFAFPISLDVTGRRCVVIGGGPVAAEKAGALCEAGADVVAVPAGDYRDDLLEGTFLAIVSGEDGTDADAAFAAAERHGVLINVMDDIPRCHFAFPSVIRRGDLRLAISTGGRAPALSRRLRLHLEEQLPQALGELIDAVAEAREITLPRTIPWGEWVSRWREAVSDLDGLLDLAEQGRTGEVRDAVVTTVTRRAS